MHHERIKISAGSGVSLEGMALHIDAIREFAAREMVKALSLELNYPVSEYNPSNDFLRQ